MVEVASKTTPCPSAWRWSAKASSAWKLHLPVPPVRPASLTPRSRLIRLAARWTRSWSAVRLAGEPDRVVDDLGRRERGADALHVIAEVALPRRLAHRRAGARVDRSDRLPEAVGDLAIEVDVVDVDAGVALGEPRRGPDRSTTGGRRGCRCRRRTACTCRPSRRTGCRACCRPRRAGSTPGAGRRRRCRDRSHRRSGRPTPSTTSSDASRNTARRRAYASNAPPSTPSARPSGST